MHPCFCTHMCLQSYLCSKDSMVHTFLKNYPGIYTSPIFERSLIYATKTRPPTKQKAKNEKYTHTYKYIYIYICIYDCFPPGWHQNLQDNINFLRTAKQSSGRSHDKTKKACVFMHESSFCLHPPRLDEICVYLEVT